jgi:EpsI family protein
MISLRRTGILLAVFMIGASIISSIAKPTRYLADISPRARLSDEIPNVFKRWKKLPTDVVTVLDPTQQAVLEYLYTETLAANYVNTSNQLVMLSIAYGKDQSLGHEVHKPSLCYPAQGFTVIEEREIPLTLDTHRSIIVRYMKTQKGQRIEPLIYWTTAGDFIYRNRMQQKLIGFKYSRDNLIPDGMIVRASTLENDPAVALTSITDFVQDWYESMPEQQRRRYFGNTKP